VVRDKEKYEASLASLLVHQSQFVVAHALIALARMNSAVLQELPHGLLEDKRHVTILTGSFVTQYQLGDLVKMLRNGKRI
jgi:hypothetical protein